MKNYKEIIEKAKSEILNDIKEGIVSNTISSFSELHDFVDANYYGGFCDDGYEASKNFNFEFKIQEDLDAWIKNGGVKYVK